MPLPVPIGVQKEVVALDASGHVVVLGTAGSGKTTMAIHRAASVSDPLVPNGGRTLLLTFNTTLLRYLSYLVPPDLATRLTVENYHAFARGYLASRGKMGWDWIVKDDGARSSLIAKAASNVFGLDGDHPLRDLPVEFFSGEIAWIAKHGVGQRELYLDPVLIGRHEAHLPDEHRTAMFDIYEEYLRVRSEDGCRYDWDDVATAVLRELEADDEPRRYKHIVLDEGQDFSPEMLRSLAQAIPPDGSLTFFGDAAQQIYGRRISWRDAGLNVAKPLFFRKNYRNTKEIADLGLAIAAMPYYADEPDMVAPDEFRAAGPKPTLVRFPTEADEVTFVARQARDAAAAGQAVAILLRRRTDAGRFTSKLKGVQRLDREMVWRPGAGVSCGTIHAAKGLEFETVYLPFLTDVHLPDRVLVETVGAEEADAIDGRLLYVGVTRARQNLVLTCAAHLTPLMPMTPGLWLEVAP